MMLALGRLLARRSVAWLVVLLTLSLTCVSAWKAGQVRHEDDLLAFLPQDNEDVRTFRAVNERYGGLDVGLIGVEADGLEQGAFDPTLLADVARLTERLSKLPELDNVLSITNVIDFAPDPMGGIRSAELMEALPDSPAAAAALRDKVMARDQVVGNLVSPGGNALLIYAFPAFGSDTQAVAQIVAEAAREELAAHPIHLGGAPFVGTAIYEATQRDMRRLTPWAVGAIMLVLLVAFRDLRSVGLGLTTTAIGIVTVHALMHTLDVPLNVVLGSMPVILFAVGSAYAIHMLARYSVHASEVDPEEAVVRTVARTGPVVITAALTTALGLGSFIAMDIEPMRQFGIFTAVGVVTTLVLSVTFVPAVITLLRFQPKPVGAGATGALMARTVAAIGKNRVPVGIAAALILAVGASLLTQVDSRMDQRAFYNPDSPPDLADRFLRERFGGSSFVQVELTGDMNDPHVLRQIQALGDRLTAVDGVHDVLHIGQVVATVNDAMAGQRRLPDSSDKAGLLYGFLAGNSAVRQLIDDDRERALLHARLDTPDIDATERALAELEAIAAATPRSWSTVAASETAAQDALEQQIALHATALLKEAGAPSLAAVQAALAEAPPAPSPAAVAQRLQQWLLSGECFVPLEPDQAAAAARALVELPADIDDEALKTAIAEATGLAVESTEVDDLSWSVRTPLDEARRAVATAAHTEALLRALDLSPSAVPLHIRRQLEGTLLDRQLPTVAVPDPSAAPALSLTVTGTPVLHRGLSQSTRDNQRNSLLIALLTVAIVLSVRFRSPLAGLLAATPTAAALVLIYGGMAALGIRLDIGTSMLASLVIGAGVDYAVHLLSAWEARPEEPPAAGAVRGVARAGAAIWTNALAVALGFFVLTLGEARPLRNVGGLTAAAMVVAAGCTFVLLPLLAGRRRYGPAGDHAEGGDPADPAAEPHVWRTTP
jgi:predicted RND superfamily exporter protein